MDKFAQADADMPLDAPGRRRLPVLLRRAWYGLNQAFRRRIAGMGLTPDQFTVIRTLLEAEPDRLTQKALANAMSSDPNTIASLLERMEANGLVERRPHEKDRTSSRWQRRFSWSNCRKPSGENSSNNSKPSPRPAATSPNRNGKRGEILNSRLHRGRWLMKQHV